MARLAFFVVVTSILVSLAIAWVVLRQGDSGPRNVDSPRPHVSTDTLSVIEKLKAASVNRIGASHMLLSRHHLTPADYAFALDAITTEPSYLSYHLLLAVRQDVPEKYAGIPPKQRAIILCSALENLTSINDWGDPEGTFRISAKALIEIGEPAIEHLLPVLNNSSDAPLFGSSAATVGSAGNYRRKDYAFCYVNAILGRPVVFHPNSAERDKLIIEFCAGRK